MIYLIGGPPRCGKTSLAKKLSAHLHVPWISADTLESIVETTWVSALGSRETKEYQKLFPKSALKATTDGSNDAFYTAYSTSEIVEAYKTQAQTTWEAIRTMLLCEIHYEHSYIIEGHQLHPELVAALLGGNTPDTIKTLFLIRHDQTAIAENIQKNTAVGDWVINKTREPETFPKISAMIAGYSEYIEQQAVMYNLPVFNTDGAFSTQLEKAMRLLA